MRSDLTALVPMKGHSERVPGKNLRQFRGRPLFHWILKSLHEVPAVARVVVDTDSLGIARDVASAFPAVHIIDRPQELRGDDVPMNEIIAHDLDQVGGSEWLQTHATNPLLKAATIEQAVIQYSTAATADSLFSVTVLNTRLYDESGRALNHDPEVLLNTQDLPLVYEENSCLYLFSTETFMKSGRRIGQSPMLFPIDRLEAVDIDEEFDFRIAECLATETW